MINKTTIYMQQQMWSYKYTELFQFSNIAKRIVIFENQNVFIFYKTCLGNQIQKHDGY